MMRKFEKEIHREHPGWFQEGKAKMNFVKHRVVKKIKLRQPLYVLPMLLTILLLGVYANIVHVKNRELQGKNDYAMCGLEQKIVETGHQTAKNRDAINLVAILHNENFASVRQATGNQKLIFINRNWTIDNMPRYLKINEEDINKIKNKWLKIVENTESNAGD